jgi:hypothetical protein
LWVAVGWGTIVTSPDGIRWTVRSAGTAYNLAGIGYGNGVWLAVGSEDLSFSLVLPESGWSAHNAGGVILSSTNGITWEARPSGTSHVLTGIGYGDGLWAAVGVASDTDYALLTSTNAIDWTTVLRSSAGFSCIGYGDRRWGIGTWNSFSRESQFVFHTLPTWGGVGLSRRFNGYLNSIYYADGNWLAVGEDGTIFSSTDRFAWTRRTSGVLVTLMGVSYGDGLWVVVGEDGTILTAGQSRRRPSLSITVSGTKAVLAWPADDSGFKLESTAKLGEPQAWALVDDPSVVVNSQNTVIQPVASLARYYRLRKPE